MINSDRLTDYTHDYVFRQQLNDRLAEAEQHRMIKEFRAAHPELRPAARIARVLRRAADRLAPEQAQPIKTRPVARPL
ncbi:hypothetical protein GCM10011575_24430 [Microlunatus endophyticus]|uniref:Uncharacterized protein n=1 Tax=Microlunatus endophyticus TaxID=1716077 RepID=A0A917W437_9ACTN|nr:hypothetical protein [Microlunatus endophyticus]GGL65209.1 hypothetical protein GCM10011575_24430 [Microlunatus endophyticus]